MPRRQTINPLTIKTGEYVYIPVTKTSHQTDGNALSSFDFGCFIVKMFVSEILQTVTAVDVKQSKRNFKFVLLADPAGPTGPQVRFVVTEKAPMFRSVQDCRNWMSSRVDETFRKLDAHESRQKGYFDAKLVQKDIV